MTEQEKRDAIVKNTDRNMFVEAGAGAGKTTIIVERIMQQLKSGMKPGEIVAITFTNAASQELKERIVRKAFRESEKKDYDPKEMDNLREAVKHLDQMQISTIHSFCNRLLSERMLEARLPSGLKLIEEKELAAVREKSFGRFFEGLSKDEWNSLSEVCPFRKTAIARLSALAENISTVPSDMDISVAGSVVTNDDLEKELRPVIEKVADTMTDIAQEAYGDFEGVSYDTLSDIPDDTLTAYGIKVKAAYCTGDTADTAKALLALPNTKGFSIKVQAVKKYTDWGADKKSIKGYQDSIKESDQALRSYIEGNSSHMQKMLDDHMNSLYRLYVEIAKKAVKYFRDALPKDILTNDLLIEKTRELVLGSVDARGFFADKFKCYYIDEFQDTDHIQAEFLWTLAAEPEDLNALRDGALFVVGDPKQSIYRFRGAEPEVYFDIKKKFGALQNADVFELQNNYRSCDQVINWVNSKFAAQNITDGNPYIPMIPIKVLDASRLNHPVLSGVYRNTDPDTPQPISEIGSDIRDVTDLIRGLVNNDYYITDYDPDRKAFARRIVYSDILVLCMDRTHMQEYADSFRENGIPFMMDGKTVLTDDRAINSFIRFYAWLSDSYNVKTRAGAEEALRICGTEDPYERERILDTIKTAAKELSPFGVLNLLSEHPELYFPKGTDLKETDLNSSMARIKQMCEKAMAATFGNRAGLLRYMQDYADTELEHELVLKENKNAVRFMNLHKAKGLEGNIVIWTSRAENRSFRRGSFRKGGEYYPSIAVERRHIWDGYNGDTALMEKAGSEDACENVRLEYVAATRAKQVMIFMDKYSKGSKRSGEEALFGTIYGLSSCPSIHDIILAGNRVTTPASPVSTYVFPEFAGAGITGEMRKERFISVTPSGLEDESAGRERFILKKEDMAEYQNGGDSAEADGSGRPRGNITGNIMHRCFELIVSRYYFREKDTGVSGHDLLKGCIFQALAENREDIPEGDMEKYRKFMEEASMAFGRWFNGSEFSSPDVRKYTELPFSYGEETKSRDGETLNWVHGSADLVCILPDGSCHIFDYKSDDDWHYRNEDAFAARLKGKYSGQINSYKNSLSRLFNIPPDRIKATLISFPDKFRDKGKQMKVRLTEMEVNL
ncbi:MAG: UvrD-helicase domain-containing protein [Lachnospiraceae bacterium]|nr:UvrD-helicase domain-containing protein [Lachnospiraceae bacterium]